MEPKPLLEYQIHPSTEFGENVRLGFGVIIEEGCKIGKNTLIGHYTVLRPGTIIGDDCKIGHWIIFEGNCKIGNKVSIHPHIIITNGTIVEDEVFIAGHTITMNDARMGYLRDGGNFIPNAPKIRKRARISGASKILPGVEIGENAIVGTGSIVTKDVPPGMVVFGAPAKVRRPISQEEKDEI